MSLQELVQNYGYFAILAITFIEGETIVILAGVAAHLGYLDVNWVVATAVVGSVSGDQLWYYMGRHWGPRLIARRASWQAKADKVYKHLHRHQYFLLLTFRFYYGLRNVTPFVVGSAQIPRLRFFVLNLIGAIVWAITFSYGGYLMGQAFMLFIDDYHRYALNILGGLVAIGLTVWLATVICRRRRNARLACAAEKVLSKRKADAKPVAAAGKMAKKKAVRKKAVKKKAAKKKAAARTK
jgi:membrane protein DedA with SNARE-associated domain